MLRLMIIAASVIVLAGCGPSTTTNLQNTVEEQAEKITSLEELLRVSEFQRITQEMDEASETEKAQKVHEYWRQQCQNLSPNETLPIDLSESQARYAASAERWIADRCLAEGFSLDEILEDRRETFGSLTDFIGHRFKGISTSDDADAKADIQSWHWALGGSAILIKHALEDGSYGGDTYVYKDAGTGGLVYVYITSAGFRTEGTMTVNDDGGYTSEEVVTGHETITMVRSTSRQNEDGTLTSTSEILENGEWRNGHGFIYALTNEYLPALTPPTAE